MIYLKASGEKIREARKAANLTQVQLGEKMHVSGSMVGQYETEARRPSIKTAKEIAAILGIDARTLLVEFEADDLISVPAKLLTVDESESAKFEVIPADSRSLSTAPLMPKERIATALDLLNPDGQEKAVERVEELTEIPRYRRQEAAEPIPLETEGKDTTAPEKPAERPPEGE